MPEECTFRGPRPEEAHDPGPDAGPVVEEEEQREHRDEEAGDRMTGGHPGRRLGPGIGERRGALLPGLLDPLVEHGGVDAEGVHDPGADLVVALAHLGLDVVELVDEL